MRERDREVTNDKGASFPTTTFGSKNRFPFKIHSSILCVVLHIHDPALFHSHIYLSFVNLLNTRNLALTHTLSFFLCFFCLFFHSLCSLFGPFDGNEEYARKVYLGRRWEWEWVTLWVHPLLITMLSRLAKLHSIYRLHLVGSPFYF